MLTIYGDRMPGMVDMRLAIPRMMPEKFGLMSMMLANEPVETAPCIAVPSVMNKMARMALHPEKANAIMNMPLMINVKMPANLRTFVRLMRPVRSR